MFTKLKLLCKLLLLQLFAKAQPIAFDKLPTNNPLITERDSMLHELARIFFKQSKTAPGIIIGISQHSERQYYQYGFADTSSHKTFTPATIFEAGSVTKTFTANLILQLHHLGKLDTASSVINYLPEELATTGVLQKITIANLLCHSSGLPRLPDNFTRIAGYTFMQPYEYYGKEELYKYLAGLTKTGKQQYNYSNLGFGLLGTIAENVTGLPYETLLAKYVLEPTHMSNSYTTTVKNNNDTATGYFYDKAAPYWNFKSIAGAGALKTNAIDMLNYLEANMKNGSSAFEKAVADIIIPVKPVSPNIQIASGWHTMEDLKHRVFWHNGGTYGFSTFAAFEPVTQTAVVLASNATGVNGGLDKMAKDLMIVLTSN